MIKIDQVNKFYNKGKANEIHVINDTTLTLPDAGMICLLGPSGCGKTTLLNAIGGLDKVDNGSITIDGERITRFSSSKIDNIRNAHIGYIFQNFNLLDDRTVFDNVAIALRMIGIKEKATIDSRVRYCLEKLGIDQYRNKLAGSLSGGQRQRVAIARAIVKNPKIIIADEPTGNLDSANTLEIMNIIKTISKDRLVILVTHEKNIAEFYSDYIAEMKDGKIVNTYINDSSRSLDYQLDNKIYLKDMPVHKELQKDDFTFDVYSDEDRKTKIKLVIKGNNLYINTGGRFNVVDEKADIEMVDDHYTAMDESYFEKSNFDYTAHLPENQDNKYTSVYKFSNMLSNGWRTVKSFRITRKILMLGFVFAALFAFLAVSNVAGLIDLKPVDYRTTNGHYITIQNPERTEDLLDLIGSLDTVAYVIPGESLKLVGLPLDDYLQAIGKKEDLCVSIVLTKVLSSEQLIAGSMPENDHDVVLDKAVIDDFLRDDLGRSVGLTSMKRFIGRRITVPNLEDYRIVGISDTQSPSLFVDESQAMYVLSNADDPNANFTILGVKSEGSEEDVIKNGRVRDIALVADGIKITKGKAPEAAFETVVSEGNAEDMPIGSKINFKAGGQKLKVVGYYKSSVADDDTYYVHADTIKKDYIRRQKYATVYAPDVAVLKHMLDKAGVASTVNDSYDRRAYLNERKDQLTSALLVAGIIMLVSLIEMYLMLRSSFLSRIKEVGTLRAIGLKKRDIYRMFTGEILVITLVTALPGIAIMYFILSKVVTVTYYIEGMYNVTPQTAAITFAIILVFNLIAGLLPVFTTLRKTPAQILARTDI